ncbi:hypothetical protein [Sphingomonas sp. URHD0057]|uniref:hypothetical protein n=1 Tax=Sphingomonas sp. URHD0057 TaxID=1380389 RepID=UPI00048ECEE5|nr:hypothetical protein [Sphingomonas sp. URHD0057]
MFGSKIVLIVDGNAYHGLDLSSAIEERDGCVAGPVASIADAISILESETISAAVVDWDDCGSAGPDVVELLAERSIPMAVLSAKTLPSPLSQLELRITVLVKPVDTALLMDALLIQMG